MKKILYLGLELPKENLNGLYYHCPIIQILPRPIEDEHVSLSLREIPEYTHLIFTSKSSVKIFFEHALKKYDERLLQSKISIAVGPSTAETLQDQGIIPTYIAQKVTAEGVVELLEPLSLHKAFVFFPHSALSRPIISTYLTKQKIQHRCCVFYDTIPFVPDTLPCIEDFDEIIFTSPSTVDAFIKVLGPIPWHKTITPIGPITEKKLKDFFISNI